MEKLKKMLEKAGVGSVGIVSLPADTPQGWDLADTLPVGWGRDTLDNLINNAF